MPHNGTSFVPIKKRRAVEQVAEALRNAILDGHIEPGQTLPSERHLAEQFGVNRGTVREAISRLEVLGLVEVRHGGGARVCNFLVTAGLQLLPFLLAPGGSLDLHVLRDLLELRVMVLGWTAQQAAESIGEQGLEHIEDLVDRMESAQTDHASLKVLDYDFFDGLVALTGNRVLRLISNVIRKVYLEGPAFFDLLYAEGMDTTPHRKTIQALRDRDAPAARQAMESHASKALEKFSAIDESGQNPAGAGQRGSKDQ